MRAYFIAMALILFQLSVSIAGSLGFVGPIENDEISMERGGTQLSYSNWGGILSVAVGVVAGIGSLIFRIPVGATVFAFVFAYSSLPLNSTLSQLVNVGYLSQAMASGMQLALVFVFIFGFAQMASSSPRW